jgi:hypothetical protein
MDKRQSKIMKGRTKGGGVEQSNGGLVQAGRSNAWGEMSNKGLWERVLQRDSGKGRAK